MIDWSSSQGATTVCLWGVRLGALMAMDLVSQRPEIVKELLLWQPVYSGKQSITQFLRLRMALGMMQGQQESVGDLRNLAVLRVKSWKSQDILFALSCIEEIDQLEARQMNIPDTCTVSLFEVASSTEKPMTVPTRNQLQAWTSVGIRTNSAVVAGDPFWSTQEIGISTDLIDASSEALSSAGSFEGNLPEPIETSRKCNW